MCLAQEHNTVEVGFEPPIYACPTILPEVISILIDLLWKIPDQT